MNRLDIKPGDRFSRLTIIEEVEMRYGRRYFLCKCDCGTIKEIGLNNFNKGKTESCGCLHSEITRKRNFKHGLYGTRIHKSWRHMIDRCQNPKDKRFVHYGGRGIKVCSEWQEFINFYEWAIANGYNDTLTIERKDVDGDYCTDNCMWATCKQQQNNRRNNRYITFQGRTLTSQQWSEELGIAAGTIRFRLDRGWAVEDALFKPLKSKVIV